MNGLVVVMRRELAERRNVLIAAAVAAVLALLLPLVRGIGPHGLQDARSLAADVVACAFTFGLAIAYGASMITRDLAERRLGFYLARPLSASAIWWGKLAAGVLLLFSTGLIILLPAALAGGVHSLAQLAAAWRALGGVALAAIAVLLVVHTVFVVVRSRSPWIVLDVAALVIVALLVGVALLTMAREGADQCLERGADAFGLLFLAALLAAGAVAVAVGRADVRRAHRALSFTLWPFLLVGGTGLLGYAHWVVDVRPADLTEVWSVETAPQGDWIALSGVARWRGGYAPSFLLDTATGRSFKTGSFMARSAEAVFSGDGRTAVWLAVSGALGPRTSAQVVTLDLANRGAQPVTTMISFPMAWTELALSHDGRRLATRSEGTLSVFELPSGTLLAAAQMGERRGASRMAFLDPGHLRLLFLESERDAPMAAVAIAEFDVGARKLTATGRVVVNEPHGILGFRRDPISDHLLMREKGAHGDGVTLRDGRTGELMATLVARDEPGERRPAFLTDGRIVVGEAWGGRARLRLFSADGHEQGSVELGRGFLVGVAGEAAAGRVVVAVEPHEMAPWRTWSSFLVDLKSRTAKPLGADLCPAGALSWWTTALGAPPAPGSLVTRLFYGSSGSLILLDPLTGARRTLIAGSDHSGG